MQSIQANIEPAVASRRVVLFPARAPFGGSNRSSLAMYGLTPAAARLAILQYVKHIQPDLYLRLGPNEPRLWPAESGQMPSWSCVGTSQSMFQALHSTRPGGSIGFVGVPQRVRVDSTDLFLSQIGLRGGLGPQYAASSRNSSR
jgi:hypothetical protein